MAQPAVRQFAGDIRFWQRAGNGALAPVIPEPADLSGNQPVETNALTFAYEAGDEIVVRSKRRDARYNQPVYSDQLPGTTSVSAVLLEIPPIILARILFGDATSATVGAGSVSGQAITIDRVDVPFQLAHRMLLDDPAVVVEKGVDTLVAGTDYRIDYRRGQLIPLAGGAIEAEDELEISYSYAAHVATTILGGAVPVKSFYITGDMQDRISGKSGELRIPDARLTVDGEVDWLSEQPIQATLTGQCVVADGEAAPYTFVEYGASA